MKRFVIADIHGKFKALIEVLRKSKFDYNKDKLIVLGDVCDGGYNTYQCIEELLKIKNLIFIMGNHDEWFVDHMQTGWAEYIWLSQGGYATLESYGIKEQVKDEFIKLRIPKSHQEFFNKAKYYHIEDNMLFVHGGIKLINKWQSLPIDKQSKTTLTWDRDLFEHAMKYPVPDYKKVFIGHSTTQLLSNNPNIENVLRPLKFNNLWMMDTGAGFDGVLSILDIDTEEYWISTKQEPK